jgi:hypothetical protein
VLIAFRFMEGIVHTLAGTVKVTHPLENVGPIDSRRKFGMKMARL